MDHVIHLPELAAFGAPRRAIERLRAHAGTSDIPAASLCASTTSTALTAPLRDDAPRLEAAAAAWLQHAVALEAIGAEHGLPSPDWTADAISAWLRRVGHGEAFEAAGLPCDVALWGAQPEPVARASVRAAWSRHTLRPALCAALRWMAARWWSAPVEAHERREALGILSPEVGAWLDSLHARVASAAAATPGVIQLVRWSLDASAGQVYLQVTGQLGALARSWQGEIDLPGGGTADVHVAAPDAHADAGRLALVAGLELAMRDAALREEIDNRSRRPAWSGLVDALRALGDAADTSLAWRVRGVAGDWVVEPCRVSATQAPSEGPFTSATPISTPEAEALARHPGDHAALRLLRRVPKAAAAEVIAALAGHPRVLVATWGGGTPLAVVAAAVRPHLEPVPGGARFRLRAGDVEVDPDLPPVQLVDDVANGRLLVVSADARAIGLAKVLRREGAFVPSDALPAMASGLCALARTAGLVIDPALQPERHVANGAPALHLREEDGEVDVRLRVGPGPGCALELPGEGPHEVYANVQGALLGLHRDLAAERAAAATATSALGLDDVAAIAPWTWRVPLNEALCDLLEAAAAHGVAVSWTGPPLVVARPRPEQLKVVEADGRRWFEIGGALDVDGVEVPWSELIEAAEAGAPLLRLGGRRVVALSRAMRRVLKRVAAAQSAASWARPVALADLEDTGVDVTGAATTSATLAQLRAAWSAPWTPPVGLCATLRPHQEQGAAWLSRLGRWAPGAVLADDMGLGKTVQALAVLAERAPQGPALVVAPTSLVGVWCREAARFAPGLRVHHAPLGQAAALLTRLAAGDVLVTTWGALRRHAEALAGVPWATRVLDEAHAIKGHLTATARAARKVQSGFCVALTGTPIENQTSELWSLFDVVAPGLLGPWEGFRDRFAQPIEVAKDEAAADALRATLRPFLLRRTKAEAAPELPARREHTVPVSLSAPERALYDEARRAVLTAVEGAGSSAAAVAMLRGLQHLRMAANAPALLDPSTPIASSKRRALRDLVRQEVDAGRKVLVFSQFLGQLRDLAAWLQQRGVSYAQLDGGTPRARRDEGVARFQRGDAAVFLISLRAGGTGLTLTAAHTVIHADPWWNPAVEDQATDRAHRIGQDHPVDVYRLISVDTVEEEILRLHHRKRQLAAAVLSGAGAAARLTLAELADLIGAAA